MGKRHVRWLYAQLPELVSKGILTDAAADGLRAHYGDAGEPSGRRVALLICSILGSLLIGSGIILLLAHNWEALSRPMRTVIAVAPLVAAQALAIWGEATGRRGVAWREGVGLFLCLAVAASIALVGQTYHIPGNLGSFLLTWSILLLPVIYLLHATAPCLVFLACITWWAGYAQNTGHHAVAFWPLFACAVPHVWLSARRGLYSPRSSLLGWAVSLCLCAATGITLEKVLPGLWIVIYSALFGILYLAGGYWFSTAPGGWQKPYHLVGSGGIAVLALIFTYKWPWEDVGWRFFRYTYRYHAEAAWFDYLAAVALPVIAIALMVTAVRRRQAGRLLYGMMPLMSMGGFIWCAVGRTEALPMILFNAYLFVLGIGTIAQGIRSSRLAVVNGGMVVLTGLIVARFFDGGIGTIARAVAFIVIGAGFLTTNLVLGRKTKVQT